MKINFLKTLKDNKNNMNKPHIHKINNDYNDVHKVSYDHFPYTKFYKGEILSNEPKIDNRESGYSKVSRPTLPFIVNPLSEIKRTKVKEDYIHSNFIQSNDIWLYR